MLFRNARSFVVRLALILALLSGALGATNVQAAPLSEGDATTVLVVSTSGTPLAGKSVYAFNGTAYTGYSKVTDANGEAVLSLPEGSYRFRVDVDGTQFWSGTENHCSNCLNVTVTIPGPVLVTVQDTGEAPMAGLSVYAFNGTTYTGFHGTTNQDGQVSLRLLEGSYRFRADLNGTQFWSGASNHCDIPGCESASVTVSQPMTVTVLDTDGAPKSGLNVYAFNGSTYTGYNKVSDASGQTIFTLPLGSYRFRADLNGTQFWSETANHCDIPGCESASVIVTQPMMVTVLDTNGTPKSGLNVYAFNGSTYTGYNKITNADGQAVFTLPLGSYRFRADLNGTQFWSGTTNHCNMPGCESASVTVTIPMTVAIQDGGGAPKAGVSVYAFNGSTYTGYNKVSDSNGQAVFTLPLGSYRFRADYSGVQYWSSSANHCTLPGCSGASVTVGPALTATFTPTPVPTDTPTPTPTYTPTSTPTAVLFTISGNAGAAGATLNYMEDGISKTVVASSSGNYAIQVQPGWSGTVTPSKANATFNPSNRTYTSLQASVATQNYTATITVTSWSDSGTSSLRQAVTEASSGATIRFAPSLAGRTITLVSPVMLIQKKVTLDGSGLSPQLTISGGDTAGFHLNGTSVVDIYDLTISDFNIPFMFRADATIRNSTLKGFTGDAIISYPPASLTITNSTFENNDGPVIVAYGPATTITDSVFKNNAAETIYAGYLGTLTITNSMISDNGGDAITSVGATTIIDSNILRNNGRGILFSTSLSLINTTIHHNSAEGLTINGGGATIVNSTIAENQGGTGQILINGGSDVDIYNSTIVATTNNAVFLNGSVLNLYNSFLGCTLDTECLSRNTGTVNNVNSLLLVNGSTLAGLGMIELADHGGPTLTMALLPHSSLINAGDDAICAASPVNNLDQRGVTRPQGAHCDIGAYEYDGPAGATTTTITTSPNPSEPGQTVTAAATVSSSAGTPTGTAEFSVNGTVLCTGRLTNGIATCNLIFNETRTVVATYHPDDTDYESSSGSTVQTVGQSSTLITVTDSPDPSIQGASVTIHVAVGNQFGGTTPTGTVSVVTSDDVCEITLNSGQGSCTVTFADIGTTSITAVYSGDEQHHPSSATVSHQAVAAGPTPVAGCGSIRDGVGTIKFSSKTMYLDISNPNPYPVTISSVYVAWNYAAGHTPGDSSLYLQKAQLGTTVFWTGNLNQPYAFLPLSTDTILPASGTARMTFTFDKTYTRMMWNEQIQIQFSTSGCESYPVVVPTGSPIVTPANLKGQVISGEIDNNQWTQFSYRVQNNGSNAVSNISMRIYFTTDGTNPASSYMLEKYYDQSGAATISGPTSVSGNTYYFTVNYGTASLPAGSTWEFISALHLSTWASTYVATNDWWHGTGTLPTAWTDWNNILIYVDGIRVWGSLP